MGHKSKAVHRGDTYSTDCSCKKRQFAAFKRARAHMELCGEATCVHYNSTATGARVAYRKESSRA